MSDIHLQQISKSWYYAKGAVLDDSKKRKAKKFCLGTDYAQAMQKAQALDLAWNLETTIDPSTGLKVWSHKQIDAAMAFAVGTAPVAAPMPQPKPQPVLPAEPYVAVESYTLGTALDEFVKMFQQRTDISPQWRATCGERVKAVRRHIEKLESTKLSELGQEHLDEIRNIILARPKSALTDNPISIDTAKNWLQMMGIAFDYFAKYAAKFKWNEPNKMWRETFSLNKQQSRAISTLEEKSKDGTPKPIYTIQQVSELYKKATPMVKKYIFMGILFGWRQQDIADFRKDELLTQNGEYFIERNRGKTGVKARWWVAKEIASMLLESMKQTPANPDNRAFLTDDGQPLCNLKADSIALAWSRLLKHRKKGMAALSFGSLRRLAGQLMEDSSGSHELAQMVLSHKLNTVAASNYVSGFATSGVGSNQSNRLVEAQKKLWEQIRPLFFPVAQSVVTNTITAQVTEAQAA